MTDPKLDAAAELVHEATYTLAELIEMWEQSNGEIPLYELVALRSKLLSADLKLRNYKKMVSRGWVK